TSKTLMLTPSWEPSLTTWSCRADPIYRPETSMPADRIRCAVGGAAVDRTYPENALLVYEDVEARRS
ncbi:MAG: hypothetical protein PVF85_05620, partial [Anaerolineales bacterium]